MYLAQDDSNVPVKSRSSTYLVFTNVKERSSISAFKIDVHNMNVVVSRYLTFNLESFSSLIPYSKTVKT